jgi:hypothetical protein
LSQTRERSNGALTNDVEADGKAVWSWHPLLMPSRRRCVGPTGPRQAISADDGDKNEFVAGESAEETVKTIACGNAG